MSKQDRQGVRTVTDLERKYTFGKRFADIMGVATDAQNKTEDLEDQFNNTLTPEEIFNLLTDNGRMEGLYRGEDGELYINASYIRTGVLEMTKYVFIEPSTKEVTTIRNHLKGIATIPTERTPLYDFDEDGVITEEDARRAEKASNGEISLSYWSNATPSAIYVKLDFFSDTETIKYSAMDMWGNHIENVIGFGSAFFKTERNGCAYREYGEEKEWLNPAMFSGVAYRTAERFEDQVVYKKLIKVEFDGLDSRDVPTGIETYHSIIGVDYTFDDSYTVYSSSPDIRVSCYPGTSDYYNLLVTAYPYGICYVEIKYV